MKCVQSEVLADLRKSWRSAWVDAVFVRQLTEGDSDVMDNVYRILDLWRTLADVRNPGVTFAQGRAFTASAKVLVDTLKLSAPSHLAKLKSLEILGEVLCYGSTLGIQSEIPIEASEVAQKTLQVLLRYVQINHLV